MVESVEVEEGTYVCLVIIKSSSEVVLATTTVVVPSPFVTCFVVFTEVVPSSLKRVVVVTEPVVFSVMPVVCGDVPGLVEVTAPKVVPSVATVVVNTS